MGLMESFVVVRQPSPLYQHKEHLHLCHAGTSVGLKMARIILLEPLYRKDVAEGFIYLQLDGNKYYSKVKLILHPEKSSQDSCETIAHLSNRSPYLCLLQMLLFTSGVFSYHVLLQLGHEAGALDRVQSESLRPYDSAKFVPVLPGFWSFHQ